jgi:hypothetical protein
MESPDRHSTHVTMRGIPHDDSPPSQTCSDHVEDIDLRNMSLVSFTNVKVGGAFMNE